MKVVKLYRGTNKADGNEATKYYYDKLSWWSDNRETVEHYYEGCVLEITISIDESLEDDYIVDLDEVKIPLKLYTYGVMKPDYPVGATWYSFGPSYLNSHIKKIKEVRLEDVA